MATCHETIPAVSWAFQTVRSRVTYTYERIEAAKTNPRRRPVGGASGQVLSDRPQHLGPYTRGVIGRDPESLCCSRQPGRSVPRERTLKYEELYRSDYESPVQARGCIGMFSQVYNGQRPHGSLSGVTPNMAYTGPGGSQARPERGVPQDPR